VIDNGRLIKMVEKEDCFISCVEHKELIVTCSADGMARLWDLQGGLNEEQQKLFKERAAAKAAAAPKANPKAKAKAGAKAGAPKAWLKRSRKLRHQCRRYKSR